MLGGSLAGAKVWERGGREFRTVQMTCSLFTDVSKHVGCGGGRGRGLNGSRLTKRWQGRVVEACVESRLLYYCQVRVW